MRRFVPSNPNKELVYKRRDKLLGWLKNRDYNFSYFNDHITILIDKDKIHFDVSTMKYVCSCGFKRKGRASLADHLKEHDKQIELKSSRPKTIIRRASNGSM